MDEPTLGDGVNSPQFAPFLLDKLDVAQQRQLLDHLLLSRGNNYSAASSSVLDLAFPPLHSLPTSLCGSSNSSGTLAANGQRDAGFPQWSPLKSSTSNASSSSVGADAAEKIEKVVMTGLLGFQDKLDKSSISSNQSAWVCASLYAELNLLHAVSILLPAYAALAESLRQSAIQSLLYAAVLIQQQQQLHNPEAQKQDGIDLDAVDVDVPIRRAEESRQNSEEWCHVSTGGQQKDEIRSEQAKDKDVTVEKNHGKIDHQAESSGTNVNEVEATISIVNQQIAKQQFADFNDYSSGDNGEGNCKSERVCTPAFVVQEEKEEDGELHEDDFESGEDGDIKKIGRRSSKSSKRRVECPRCFKTYCDKGALKIHTSAVHLKETHRCTVAGCDKIFSSRRSRNRHSSNASMHNFPNQMMSSSNNNNNGSCQSRSLLSSPVSRSSSSCLTEEKSRSISVQLGNVATTPTFVSDFPFGSMFSTIHLPVSPLKCPVVEEFSPSLGRKRKRERPNKLGDLETSSKKPVEVDHSQLSALAQSLLSLGVPNFSSANVNNNSCYTPSDSSSNSATPTSSSISSSSNINKAEEAHGANLDHKEPTLRDFLLNAVAQDKCQPHLLTA